jgi:hypothetical protein
VAVTAQVTDRASEARCERLSPKPTAKRSELAARAQSWRVGIAGVELASGFISLSVKLLLSPAGAAPRCRVFGRCGCGIGRRDR